jgi:hypothetical protein
MTTRREQFAEELRKLLAMYHAEIELRDTDRCGYTPNEEMFVTMDTEYGEDGDIVADFEEFSIGRWVSGETVL